MKNISFKRSIVYIRTYLKVILFFVIFSYLLINIFSSQFISPLYFQIIKEDKNAIISFLQKIKKLSIFNNYLITNKAIYGSNLEQEVFEDDQIRKKTIVKLEEILQKNSKSRDTLYNLYLLYKEHGNNQKAEEYLKKAREVDPSI